MEYYVRCDGHACIRIWIEPLKKSNGSMHSWIEDNLGGLHGYFENLEGLFHADDSHPLVKQEKAEFYLNGIKRHLSELEKYLSDGTIE